ncbi:putative MATE family efflux protein [Clostridium saccharoperbutylacetonicum]|uniref:Probable multidrug resistance protein NorM n=1 Tax=Clostridium saccharoperbutylacetonicum N1-4(HMT) TaxID=931276 RepID=M1LXD9_9CLOT|nr:MATE family efflux transporter [Clostridium saccharoperbutylacetonicum]AGF57925.1 MATE efflux family protein [Clostridium saccharoperbutylacetonicum N1-4(HMT)]NRT61302.1 putative MATE family efflux protein [Clostridium saccharoperbutylacetonicum]NSB24619.1 putative MATE family efflux protein [Clostridium saccharoperbutylacetonicum]NSB43994.1 putative MATE family efflux protein [Clostridium saccharoperbutylacetonicum]
MLIRKNVLKLTIPIIIEQTFVMLLGVCNTIMAGHIGKEAVSAIGMVDSMNNLFISFFAALSVGATVVVAQQIGQGQTKKANETAKQAIASGLVVSGMITLFLWIFRVPIINVLYGSAEELVKLDAKLYIEFTLLTYPFIAIEQISNGILRGTGDTKTPMLITMFMNVVNIILGYILIYGIDAIHIPSFGIMGAAMAIAIARTIGTIVIIFVLLRGSKNIKIKKIYPFKFDMKIQKNIFNIGVPAGMEAVIFQTGKLLVQVFIVTMGTASIAANAIGMSISQIINVPGNALCLAATTLVGQYIGRNDIKGGKNTLIYLVKFATICLVFVAMLFVPIAEWVAGFYTTDPEVIRLTATLLKSNSIAMVTWGISFVLSSGLKGAGDTRYTMMTAFIGMWVFRIGLGYIFGIVLKIGVLGIWLAMYVDWIVRGSLYCMRLRGEKWIKHRIKG